MRLRGLPGLIAAVSSASLHAGAACPTGLVVTVDNDTPSSGYSEVKPENWVSHDVESCQGTYRYLSQYVGDGTRKGKAIWQPPITVAGTYAVLTGFRASVNRTNDADYSLFGDDATVTKKSVNQQSGSGCQKVSIGNVFCQVGGSCHLELDGDDGKSDAADVTTFELVACDAIDAGTTSPCSAISQVSAYEVCEQTATTCAGTFNDGSGCNAYCAAAGMQCVASFGGEPGCSKEAATPLPCSGPTSHLSDWCECALPAGTGGTGGVAGSTGIDAAADDAATASGGSSFIDASSGPIDASSSSGGKTSADDSSDEGGCGCRATAREASSWTLFWFSLLAALAYRRFTCTRGRT